MLSLKCNAGRLEDVVEYVLPDVFIAGQNVATGDVKM